MISELSLRPTGDGRFRIDVNEVKAFLKKKEDFNDIPLRNIIWMNGKEEIEIPADRLEEWRFCGLTNCYFIEYGMHEHGFEVIEEPQQPQHNLNPPMAETNLRCHCCGGARGSRDSDGVRWFDCHNCKGTGFELKEPQG